MNNCRKLRSQTITPVSTSHPEALRVSTIALVLREQRERERERERAYRLC